MSVPWALDDGSGLREDYAVVQEASGSLLQFIGGLQSPAS